MKYLLLVMFLSSALAHGQMELRDSELYARSEFRKSAPAVGKKLSEFKLKDLDGKEVSLAKLREKPLVIISGAYT